MMHGHYNGPLRLETMFSLNSMPDAQDGEQKALLLELRHRNDIRGRDLQCMTNLLEDLFAKIHKLETENRELRAR